MEITAFAPRGLGFRRLAQTMLGWINTYRLYQAGVRAERHLFHEADDRQLADVGLTRDTVRLDRIVRSGCPRP